MKIIETKAVNTADFDQIETHFNCSVSKDIRSFLEQKNGTIESPENGVEITYINDLGKPIKDGFPVIHHPENITQQLQFIDYIEDMLEDSNWKVDDVEWDKLMPLMSVNGGSINLYIALCGTHQNKLFVVDNGDYGLSKVEMTFIELLQQIGS